jgi:hypothetical protein
VGQPHFVFEEVDQVLVGHVLTFSSKHC